MDNVPCVANQLTCESKLTEGKCTGHTHSQWSRACVPQTFVRTHTHTHTHTVFHCTELVFPMSDGSRGGEP